MFPVISPRRSSASAVERTSLPTGLAGALALHGGIIAALLITWTQSFDVSDQQAPIVPVDLVTIGEKTNIMPTVKQEVTAPPKEEAQPPEPAAPPPPDDMSIEPVPKTPPQVVPKTKPQPEKKEQFNFDKLVNDLSKDTPAKSSVPNAKRAERTQKGIGAMNAMEMDLIDSLKNQMQQCWSPLTGAPHPEQLIVQWELLLNTDGRVAQAQPLTGDGGNSFLRAANGAAQRAIYACQPYTLPADRYGQWRDIVVTFDPREMGQ